jgi:hypothetical protein
MSISNFSKNHVTYKTKAIVANSSPFSSSTSIPFDVFLSEIFLSLIRRHACLSLSDSLLPPKPCVCVGDETASGQVMGGRRGLVCSTLFSLCVFLSITCALSLSLSLTLSLSLHSLPFYFFAIFILLSVCVIELNVGHRSVVASAVSVREIIGAERQTK